MDGSTRHRVHAVESSDSSEGGRESTQIEPCSDATSCKRREWGMARPCPSAMTITGDGERSATSIAQIAEAASGGSMKHDRSTTVLVQARCTGHGQQRRPIQTTWEIEHAVTARTARSARRHRGGDQSQRRVPEQPIHSCSAPIRRQMPSGVGTTALAPASGRAWGRAASRSRRLAMAFDRVMIGIY